MIAKTLALTLVLALQACGGGPERAPENPAELMARWKAELIAADEAFSDAIDREGLSQWSSFFTAEGSVIQAGVGEIQGAEAMQAVMDAAAGAVTSFSWTPERAEVSTGGDMGYTVGRYRTTAMGTDSVEMVSTGMYVSIWRRQEDGSWKVEMDLGNPLTDPTPISSLDPTSGAGGDRP
jgi:ketosteroid isomerase-like protein